MSDTDEMGSNLFAEAEEAPAPEKSSTPRKARAKKAVSTKASPDRTWIVLEESDDVPPTGLPIGVNGDVMMVLPGEPVHIQNKYLEVLDHAIVSVPTLNSSQQIIGQRQRHRFPYRAASRAEIEAATDKS